MANQFKRVKPGDLITADLINSILDGLEGTAPSGEVIVPDVFGRTIRVAQQMFQHPSRNLRFGIILDAYGNSVDPDLPKSKMRVIINQIPVPGTRVSKNTSVALLLAAVPGTEPPPVPDPEIKEFRPKETPINDYVTIHGENFAQSAEDHEVTFAGVPITEPPTSAVPTYELRVLVPEIPDPPVGDDKKEVTVVVKRLTDNATASGKCFVLAPLPGEKPVITDINPVDDDKIYMYGKVEIIGENFSTTKEDNTVYFGDLTATPESATATRLVVKVPKIAGINGAPWVLVDIKVEVEGRESIIKRRKINKK
jgi:hypothetical protein